MTASENICPNCKSANTPGAVVCWQCGVALGNPSEPGSRGVTTDALAHTSNGFKDWPIDEVVVPSRGIAVYVEGLSVPAYVDSKGEFVIGRWVDRTTEMPDDLLDLSPLGGFGLGVSRQHALIRRADQGYEILDLGSVNGSWLGEERLVPRKAYPLESGSHLRLGNMRLYVIYSPEKK